MKELIYLAAPYKHDNKATELLRFEMVNKVGAHLLGLGYYIYSPLSHCRPMAHYGLPKDFAFFKSFDEHMLSLSHLLLILKLPGWDISVGVKGELEYANKNKLKTILMTFNDIFEHEDLELVLGPTPADPRLQTQADRNIFNQDYEELIHAVESALIEPGTSSDLELMRIQGYIKCQQLISQFTTLKIRNNS